MNTIRPTASSSMDSTHASIAGINVQTMNAPAKANQTAELKALEQWLNTEHLQVLQIFLQLQAS